MLSECIEDAHMRKKRRAFVVAYQIQRLLYEHENGMLECSICLQPRFTVGKFLRNYHSIHMITNFRNKSEALLHAIR